MNFFEEATLRLKQQLAVKQDKEVAHFLGLSPRAWAGRKQGSTFPEKELRALAQQRPELGIDVEYVLTGRDTKTEAVKAAMNMGVRFKEIRGQRSLDEFAQALGTTPDVIAGIEAQAQLPTPELLMRLISTHPDTSIYRLLSLDPVKLNTPLEEAEAILIMNFRAASNEGRAALQHLAGFYARGAK